jgi:dipeptidase E
MKFYLSSFEIGNYGNDLVRLLGQNKKIAYIPNAGDYTKINYKLKNSRETSDINNLKELGLTVEYLDLKDYFHKTDKLRTKLNEFSGVFIRGGNTFILRQAMFLSGFDKIFEELKKSNDFVYAGYSAALCVLAPDFKGLQIVDDPSELPYKEIKKQMWQGLNFFDYILLPHYKSNHPESEDIDKEVEFCKQNNIKFKTLSDGEVIIIE